MSRANPTANARHGKKPILILGGGFGGLRVARLLSKKLKRLGQPLALADKHRHHVYTPLLYEVASGCTTGAEMETPLIRGASFRYPEIMRTCCEVAFLEREAAGLDARAKRVSFADGTTLGYHTLVLALGAETDFFGIQGLREHALTLKTRRDALDIRRRIETLMGRSNGRKNGKIRILVGGGGATGTEFAAEMACCFRAMERRAIKRGTWEVTLVEATGRLLGMLKPELSTFAKRRLERLGVRVMLDTCFKRIEDGTVTVTPRPLKLGEEPTALLCDLRPGAEKTLSADLVVWTGGIRGPSVLNAFGLPLDPKGRVIVGTDMRVQGRKDVYALGDCASLVHPKTKVSAPALGQTAIRQADVAASNILADLAGRRPHREYDFPSWPTVIPLGGKHAIASIGRLTLTGLPGYIVRRAADLRYFLSALPLWYALRAFIRGAWLYVQND